MAGLFERTRDGGAAIALEEVEVAILRSLEVQMLELIGPGPGEAPGAETDPFAALFADGPTEAPGDPALARLFPDAYGEPGKPVDAGTKAAAGEFRRYTELDLRARKREDALLVIRSLDTVGQGAGCCSPAPRTARAG